MRHEFEAVRSELRKRLVLPEEVAKSAAQMRRVVFNQIEILAELDRIVGSDPHNPLGVKPAVGEPTTPKVLAPAGPVRRTTTSEHGPVFRGPGKRVGWLSELLARASQESEAASREPPLLREDTPGPEAAQESAHAERNTIDPLDSLALIIARMIDHDAVAELWERYNRGERNVFSGRLYTAQGQKEFEELSRKYRSDRDFMRTVDRYISEFERLLEEVSRDNRGQAVARTYLTSETGKVYTMLAHAAGRFD